MGAGGPILLQLALVAVVVCAGVAGTAGCVLVVVATAEVLAEVGRQVEIGVVFRTLPGLHVEDCGFAPREPARTVESPRPVQLYPEGGFPVVGAVSERPLVLVPAPAIDSLEGSTAHDKVVHKLVGDSSEAPLHVVEPGSEHDVVLLRGLHVDGVEDHLAEVHVCDQHLSHQSGVPHVVGRIDDLGVDVELYGVHGATALEGCCNP